MTAIRFDRTLPMHPRERDLAVSNSRDALRVSVPTPLAHHRCDWDRGALPGRIRSLTSSSLSRHRQHRVCPAAALLRRVDRLAPTHTAVLTSKTKLSRTVAVQAMSCEERTPFVVPFRSAFAPSDRSLV